MAKSENTRGDAPVRRRDADRTRAALLKAGLREFAQSGFSGARLERVVKSAGCNIRMVYHYFGGKDGLYKAVLEAAAEQVRQAESGLDIDLDRPLAGMLELMRFSYEFFERYPLIEALFRTEDLTATRRTMRLSPMAKGVEARVRLIGDLIVSGQAKGLFRDDLDPLQVHITITALSRFRLGDSQFQALAQDAGGRRWREQRVSHCLSVVEALLLDNRVKKRLIRAPMPAHVPTAPPRRRPERPVV
jgi:AcrR family transcriptional regulator